MTLLEERAAAIAAIKEAEDRLELIDNAIYAEVQAKVKPLGSTTLEYAGARITVTIPSRVKWDQDTLRDIEGKIKGSGDDPTQYIDYKLNVKESSYKAWPESMRKVFEPARTVEPGKRKIEVK